MHSLPELAQKTHYPASEIDVLAQRFIDDQVAFARVLGINPEDLFEANNDLDELGFVNNPFGMRPRPAAWFQLAIGAFVEHVIGPKHDEVVQAHETIANKGRTEDAFITTIVDFERLDYPQFSQSSYPGFVIRESSLSEAEKVKLIEHLRGLYERWEFSKLYYASINKINPFNNLLDQICVVLARLDAKALPNAKIFPDHSPRLETFSADDLFFSGEGNEYYTPDTWYGWTRNRDGEVEEPFYVRDGDKDALDGRGVRYLTAHNYSDPMWGRTGYVPSTRNVVFVDSFLENNP